jgi:AraC-like DNA-binding protein/mannose-6-phosphate isomerase-like protein (cupin superfamily)
MTEPSYRLITPQANRSFVFKWEPFGLTTRWHYHPEIELIFFIEGCTSAVIGDGFQQFKEGDLVIFGANFPHVLQENKVYATQHPNAKPFGLIIQFTLDFLGKEFINKPELFSVKTLLQKAQRGLHFHKSAVDKVTDTLMQMYQLNESRKLLSLLDVLTTLAEGEAFDFLTPKGYLYDPGQDEERMHNIHQYVYEHFTEPIPVKDIAAIANMTETSFCRYFKTRTLKHFTQFVNEIRVAYSCRLLNINSYTVTQACFESGFNNLSYFNRQFKQVMKLSPQQYQKWKKEAVLQV